MSAATETETTKPAVKTPKDVKTQAAGIPAWFWFVIDGAVLSWMAGIALGHGWGVSVPFMAGWVGMVAVFYLITALVNYGGAFWFRQKFKAAAGIAATEETARQVVAATLLAQQASSLTGFLDSFKLPE